MPAPTPKVKRNKQVYNDWKNGMSAVDMVAKYRITSTRIYKIVENEKKRRIAEGLPVDNDIDI